MTTQELQEMIETGRWLKKEQEREAEEATQRKHQEEQDRRAKEWEPLLAKVRAQLPPELRHIVEIPVGEENFWPYAIGYRLTLVVPENNAHILADPFHGNFQALTPTVYSEYDSDKYSVLWVSTGSPTDNFLIALAEASDEVLRLPETEAEIERKNAERAARQSSPRPPAPAPVDYVKEAEKALADGRDLFSVEIAQTYALLAIAQELRHPTGRPD